MLDVGRWMADRPWITLLMDQKACGGEARGANAAGWADHRSKIQHPGNRGRPATLKAMKDEDRLVTHHGGCHCGKVRFEVDAPARLEAQLCNCSICSMTAYLHLIVPSARFRLIQGEGELATYTFNTGIAKHHFCRTCGIKSFYIPRSNPDGISVNVRCLDRENVAGVSISDFDGQNWEEHADRLKHLSRDGV